MIPSFHTAMIIFHLAGLVLGVGGAIAVDLLLLRGAMLRRAGADLMDTVTFLSHLVSAGLAMLWVSGIVLTWRLYTIDPRVVGNEKIWAKVLIVSFLTIGAVNIHRNILPMVRARLGRPLLADLDNKTLAGWAFAGALSINSWIFPVVLGVAREWNYVVPAGRILDAYTLSVLVTFVVLALGFVVGAERVGRDGRAGAAHA